MERGTCCRFASSSPLSFPAPSWAPCECLANSYRYHHLQTNSAVQQLLLATLFDNTSDAAAAAVAASYDELGVAAGGGGGGGGREGMQCGRK